MKTQKIASSIIGKIALLSLLFFFVGMTTTFAQSERGKEMRNKNATPTEKAEKKSQKWKTKFSLNDTQTAQLKTDLLTRITKMETVKGEGKSPEKKAQRQAIMTEFEAQVKRIFTPSQYIAYEKMKEEKKENRKKNKGKGKGKKGKKADNDDDDDDF
jgi:Spy/CpxP family protein refolding chaperone